MLSKLLLYAAALAALTPLQAGTQSAASPDLAVLTGLAPVTVLLNTPAGKAALDANLKVTGGLQTGSLPQPTLLPFPEQQQQALRDTFETTGNLAELADGLGTTLDAAYLARAHYLDTRAYTRISPAVTDLIVYAVSTSARHSNAGKYLFANATTDGKSPAAADLLAILNGLHGATDVFGKRYNLPGGSPHADAYGNSRPFMTEPTVARIAGPDYFNLSTDNTAYTRGPIQNLVDSPSYPSGHTTYGYTGSLLLAILIPERYQQMIVRGAEYGNDRILVGAHYAMDVLGGRALALYDMAHLLANDPAYLGRATRGAAPIADFQAALKTARADLDSALQTACGQPVSVCAGQDIGRFSNPAAGRAFYESTQTYSLPIIYPQNAAPEDVAKIAPEAGYLLTAAFPSLTLQQADRILTETEGPGGGFLDQGSSLDQNSSFGVYSRLNLYAAAGQAATLSSATSKPNPSASHPLSDLWAPR